VSYYANILGGLYAEELLSFFIFFLPRPAIEKLVEKFLKSSDNEAERKLGEQAERMLVTDETVASVRVQGLIFLGILALSMFLYGALWFMPLLILAARAFFISFANNLPHYATTDRDRKFGLNLSMPRWTHLFYLNFYHHRAHHHSPAAPWPGLPGEFGKKEMSFDKPLIAAALAQFKGPLPVSAAGSQGEGTSSTS
jgi:fatty acid desaturase